MKTAVCLYGLFTHHFHDSGERGYEHIKREILSKVPDADFFCHSWDVEKEDLILDWYKPKKSIIEPQIDFSDKVNAIDLGRYLYTPHRNWQYIFRAFSFYYTRAKSIELKKQYEEENNFKYDCVITCRYDLGQRDRDQTLEYYVSRINFDPNNDMSYMYSAMWNQINAGMADQWFYSNSENMNKFIDLYEKMSLYLSAGSDYEKLVTEGGPDSNMFNNPSDDPRQYTNEVFLSDDEKSLTPMKYDRWECVNNHIMHKYFMIETGLYEKCKYLKG